MFFYKKIKIFSILAILILFSSCVNSTADKFDLEMAANKENLFDVLIFGSGPAGLASAMYAARSRLKTGVITGAIEGGQLMLTTRVENILGLPDIMGPQFMGDAMEQVKKLGVDFIYDSVKNIESDQWPYKVVTDGGVELYALSIVIATGVKQKKLGVPGEEEYAGSGVSYCAVCDASFYKEEEVIVVGGGDHAVHEAIQLSKWAKKVYIFVRKDEMKAMPIEQENLSGYDNVIICWNTEVREILGVDGKVNAVKFFDNKSNKEEIMPIGGVFVAVGNIPNTEYLKGMVKLDSQGFVESRPNSQMTSVPGIFVAGDAQGEVGHQVQIAAGRGVEAGRGVVKFLVQEVGLNKKAALKLKDNYFKGISLITNKKKKIIQVNTLKELELINIKSKETNKSVLLYFGAKNCPTCRIVFPIFSKVAEDYFDRAIFVKVNADTAGEIVKKFIIKRVPFLLALKDGNLVARYGDTIAEQKDMINFIESFIGLAS